MGQANRKLVPCPYHQPGYLSTQQPMMTSVGSAPMSCGFELDNPPPLQQQNYAQPLYETTSAPLQTSFDQEPAAARYVQEPLPYSSEMGVAAPQAIMVSKPVYPSMGGYPGSTSSMASWCGTKKQARYAKKAENFERKAQMAELSHTSSSGTSQKATTINPGVLQKIVSPMGQASSRRQASRAQPSYRTTGTYQPQMAQPAYTPATTTYQPAYTTATPATRRYATQPQQQEYPVFTPTTSGDRYRYSYGEPAQERFVGEQQQQQGLYQQQPQYQVSQQQPQQPQYQMTSGEPYYGPQQPVQPYFIDETRAPSQVRAGWNRLTGSVQSGVGRMVRSDDLVGRGVMKQQVGKAEQIAAKYPGRQVMVEQPTGMQTAGGGTPVVERRSYVAPEQQGYTSSGQPYTIVSGGYAQQQPLAQTTSASGLYAAGQPMGAEQPPATPRLESRQVVQEQTTGAGYEAASRPVLQEQQSQQQQQYGTTSLPVSQQTSERVLQESQPVMASSAGGTSMAPEYQRQEPSARLSEAQPLQEQPQSIGQVAYTEITGFTTLQTASQ